MGFETRLALPNLLILLDYETSLWDLKQNYRDRDSWMRIL